MPSTAQSKPASDRQLAYIERLVVDALRNDDDDYDYNDRLKDRLGEDVFVLAHATAQSSAVYVWNSRYLAADGERITSQAASACIEILKAMVAEPRCSGYCGARGVQHSRVHYYDGHYDYECGLS